MSIFPKYISKIHFFLFAVLGLLASCIDRVEYPKEPFIEYENFFIFQDPVTKEKTGIIMLSFTDGDGDIGLEVKDTIYPYHADGEYYYNYIMNIFRKQGNDTLRLPYNMRIPPINPDDYEQNLKGEIYIDIPINELQIVLPDNKFQFEAFIYDRALHKSNIITSPVILLD